MKNVLIVLITCLLFASSLRAESCLSVRMLQTKLDNDIKIKNDLESSIYLSSKLSDAAKWAEFSNIKEAINEGEENIESTVYSASEIDILLLMDMLSDKKSSIYSEMGKTGLTIAGSIAMTYVTTKVVNKLLAGGFKSGFMMKIQKMINSPERSGKVTKIMHLSNALALITPAYLAHKEYKLYKMLEETKQKFNNLEEIAQSLPELSILEERIEHDKIRLLELGSSSKCL